MKNYLIHIKLKGFPGSEGYAGMYIASEKTISKMSGGRTFKIDVHCEEPLKKAHTYSHILKCMARKASELLTK